MTKEKDTEKQVEKKSIWEEIKDREMAMFGLPQQPVSNFFQMKFEDDKSLLLSKEVKKKVKNKTLSVSAPSAAVSVLEETLNSWIDRNGISHREVKFSVETSASGDILIQRIQK